MISGDADYPWERVTRQETALLHHFPHSVAYAYFSSDKRCIGKRPRLVQTDEQDLASEPQQHNQLIVFCLVWPGDAWRCSTLLLSPAAPRCPVAVAVPTPTAAVSMHNAIAVLVVAATAHEHNIRSSCAAAHNMLSWVGELRASSHPCPWHVVAALLWLVEIWDAYF